MQLWKNSEKFANNFCRKFFVYFFEFCDIQIFTFIWGLWTSWLKFSDKNENNQHLLAIETLKLWLNTVNNDNYNWSSKKLKSISWTELHSLNEFGFAKKTLLIANQIFVRMRFYCRLSFDTDFLIEMNLNKATLNWPSQSHILYPNFWFCCVDQRARE
jgi:hypothetical protein